MAKRNKYCEYSKTTQAFMSAVEKHLIDKFGEINNEWEGILSMLATQYQVFIDCRERIKQDGLMITDRFSTLIKHPLLKVMTDSQIQIVKLVQEFGLSPKSLHNLKLESNEDNEFIESLTSGD